MTQAQLAALWDRLHAELARAENEHRKIQAQMDRMLRESPSGVPLSDGMYRQVKAAGEARIAFENYQRAVERFRGLVDKGIVPYEFTR